LGKEEQKPLVLGKGFLKKYGIMKSKEWSEKERMMNRRESAGEVRTRVWLMGE